jgi:NhaP-type Na+/H+ or K+/H+ antiporter
MNLDRYELALCLVGVAALLSAWIPAFVSRRALSLPIVLVALGVVVFLLPLDLDAPDPTSRVEVTERLTELGVIVALMGAGLKIDRRVGWRSWASSWRLVMLAMPLTIAAGAALGAWGLGLGAASAVLLGAALAPTDPVLASEVQVGEPTVEPEQDVDEPAEDEVRFALTSEGGLNDALAFPFVYMAIDMAEHGADPSGWLLSWVTVDLLYRVSVGLIAGVAIGSLLAVIVFRPPGRLEGLAESSQGFVALAATFLAYGVTELAHGYGFLAVFVAAVTLRSSERGHSYHAVLHNFSEQAENLLVVGLLVLFGGALTAGLLDHVTWEVVGVAAALLLVVRPATAWIALHGVPCTPSERLAIAFFGVRGIGSLYYVAFALSATTFERGGVIWSTVGLTIVGSIILHGTTATPVMRRLDDARESWERRRKARMDRRSKRAQTGGKPLPE